MALRAPKPEERPAYVDREHTIEGHWEPTKWLRVVGYNGRVLLETSNPEDDGLKDAVAQGWTLERRWHFVPAVHQYRRVTR